MRILVTGGAGFIGSALCRHLILNVGAEVINVDKLTYAGRLESLHTIANHPNYRFIKADICDNAIMADLFSHCLPDAVIHLAAESHVDRSIDGPAPFLQTNIIGTFSILEAARNYWGGLSQDNRDQFRVLCVSTDEVFGSLGPNGLFDENSSYDPSSPYSASKASADHLARAWHRTYGLPVIISNCSNNYGPFHFPEKLIPLVILNALHGRQLPVYGSGTNVRDWLHVEDHVRALQTIIEHGRPGESYCIGSRAENSNLQTVTLICDILDQIRQTDRLHRELITFVPDRPGHDDRYAINPTKIEKELGWRATVEFETGLRRTIDWFIQNEWWWLPLTRNAYAGQRLGLSANLGDFK